MVSHDRVTSSAAPAAAGAGVKRASTDSRVYDTSAGTRTRLVYYQTGDGQWVTMAEPEDDTFEEDRSSNTSSICGCAVWVFVLIIVLISVLVLGGIIVAIVLLAANNASDTGNNHTPAQPRPPPTGDDILDSLVNMNKDVPEENLPGYHQRHVSAYTRLASPSGNLLAEITNNAITGEERYSYTATDRLFDDGQTIVAFLSRIGVRSRSTQTVLPQNFTMHCKSVCVWKMATTCDAAYGYGLHVKSVLHELQKRSTISYTEWAFLMQYGHQKAVDLRCDARACTTDIMGPARAKCA